MAYPPLSTKPISRRTFGSSHDTSGQNPIHPYVGRTSRMSVCTSRTFCLSGTIIHPSIVVFCSLITIVPKLIYKNRIVENGLWAFLSKRENPQRVPLINGEEFSGDFKCHTLPIRKGACHSKVGGTTVGFRKRSSRLLASAVKAIARSSRQPEPRR